MLHLQHPKIHPNLKAIAQLAYIVTDADCDYGSLFWVPMKPGTERNGTESIGARANFNC